MAQDKNICGLMGGGKLFGLLIKGIEGKKLKSQRQDLKWRHVDRYEIFHITRHYLLEDIITEEALNNLVDKTI